MPTKIEVTANIDAFLTAETVEEAKAALDAAVGQTLSIDIEVGTEAPEQDESGGEFATGVLSVADIQDGDSVLIGDIEYQFVDAYTIPDVAYEVEVSVGDIAQSIIALALAINGENQRDEAHPLVSAVADVEQLLLTARQKGDGYNSVATLAYGLQGSFAESTLTGGVDIPLIATGPPYIRIAGGKIYALDDGVWKQASLSALS